ncbi:hypothetical protein [Streptomyces odontomachi]|uniref:hypothetical protein n=1 Tax=Streptomyces odontomachi TaxID=2944940 RepID=UPI00210F1352|nr:hypothetical protein [Streptomyces sp. ODS25]
MTDTWYDTLLLVVDDTMSSSLPPLLAQRDRMAARGIRLRVHDYAEVLAGIPALSDQTLAILGFPHAFWDGHIDGVLPGPYGTTAYVQAIQGYLRQAGAALHTASRGTVRYLNRPEALALTREKGAAQRRLAAQGVPVPEQLTDPTPDGILAELGRGESLYVKAVCGSMGKGLTHLAPDRWQTNYHYDGENLLTPAPPGGDADWERREQWLFRDVEVGDKVFLDVLCDTRGFLFERGIGNRHEAPGHPEGSERTEFRVTVAAAEVFAVEERNAPGNALTTRRADGGHSHAADRTDPRARAAGQAGLAAARALGLGYAMFDVVTDPAGAPYVVDTTAFPATSTPTDRWTDILDLLATRTPPDLPAEPSPLDPWPAG